MHVTIILYVHVRGLLYLVTLLAAVNSIGSQQHYLWPVILRALSFGFLFQ